MSVGTVQLRNGVVWNADDARQAEADIIKLKAQVGSLIDALEGVAISILDGTELCWCDPDYWATVDGPHEPRCARVKKVLAEILTQNRGPT